MKKLIYISLLLMGMPLIARAQTYAEIAAVSHASGNRSNWKCSSGHNRESNALSLYGLWQHSKSEGHF